MDEDPIPLDAPASPPDERTRTAECRATTSGACLDEGGSVGDDATIIGDAGRSRACPAPPTAPAAAVAAARAFGDPIIGKEIGGASISAFVGEGGMGRVYQGTMGDPPRRVAIKLLSRGFNNPEAVGRFQREAAILDRLRHPGIAEIISHGVWDDGSGGVPYMVIEFVEDARELADFASQKHLDRRGRLELFHRACEAVAFAHEMGVLHRDLKSANLLVDRWGRVKVIDFGVARVANGDLGIAGVRTETGQLIGTIQYMSPEQISGDPRAVDLRTDVYALGVILYELLVEAFPYEVRGLPLHEAARLVSEATIEPPRSIDQTIDEALEVIVMRCLDRDRLKRFANAGEVARALACYLAGPGLAARSTGGRSSMAVGAGGRESIDDDLHSPELGSHAELESHASARSGFTAYAPGAGPHRSHSAHGSRVAHRTGSSVRARTSTMARADGASGGGWGLVFALVIMGVTAALVATGVVKVKELQRWIPGSLGGSASPAGASAAAVVESDAVSTESLAIVSAPAGATVTIDGQTQGRTPLSLMLTWTAASSRRIVEVTAPGYESAAAVIMPDPSGRRAEPLRLVFNLAPRRDGRLTDSMLERLLALEVEGGRIEVRIDGAPPRTLDPGRREVPLSLSRSGDSWAPARVTLAAPGRRIEAFGQSGDGELAIELAWRDLGDQPQRVRIMPP